MSDDERIRRILHMDESQASIHTVCDEEDRRGKVMRLRELVWGMDIMSPTCPEYVELHEKMQSILRFIDRELL